jgi:hypothetical protein
MRLILLTLITFSMLYPSFLAAAGGKNDLLTLDDNGYLSIRLAQVPGDSQENKRSILTRDDNGYLAQRVVWGAGSGGGSSITSDTYLQVAAIGVGTVASTTGTVTCSSVADTDSDWEITSDGDFCGNSYGYCGDDPPADQDVRLRIPATHNGNAVSFQYGTVERARMPSTGQLQVPSIRAYSTNADTILQLSNNSYDFSGLEAGGSEVWKIDSQGRLFTKSILPYTGTADLIFQCQQLTGDFSFLDPFGLEIVSINTDGRGEFKGGLQTVDGSGASIGGSAPTTNALLLGDCDDTFLQVPGAGYMGFYHKDSDNTIYVRSETGTAGNFGVGSISGSEGLFNTVGGDAITNKAKTGAPSFTFGLTSSGDLLPNVVGSGNIGTSGTYWGSVNASRAELRSGLTLQESSTPATPAANKAALYLNSTSGYLDLIKDDGSVQEIERKLCDPSVVAGSIGIGTPVTITGIAANTWTKVVLNITTDDTNDFAWDAVNERFYLSTTGVTNRKFTVDAATSVSTTAINHDIEFVMRKNGTAVDSTYIKRYISSNDTGALSTPGTVSLSTNDYIELWVRATNATNMTFESFSLVLKEY